MEQISHPIVGERAPDFALPDIDGRVISLAETRQTHHVVLHFVREFS